MKVITICGSLKFQKEMMLVAQKLTSEGNCVLTPVYQVSKETKKTEEEIERFKNAHFKKIELSDMIYIVNKNKYIGESTRLEIEYAKNLDKEIIYME